MQIQSNSHTTIAPTQTTDKANTHQANTYQTKAKSDQSSQPNINAYQQTKKMQNLAVINAHSHKSAANNPMQLLYKTAIEEINKQLEPIFGKNAAESAYESELDVSPEATAQRIVQGSTAFFQAFKEQNSELSEEDSLTEFLKVISTGIEKGFEEAREILDSLSVLEDELATNIDLTYGFVTQGLTNFKEQFMANLVENKEANEDANDNVNNNVNEENSNDNIEE